MRSLIPAILAAAVCHASARADDAAAHASPVCFWNAQVLAAVQRDATAPALAARHLAILHAALHDGLESLHGGSRFILVRAAPPAGVDAEAFIHLAAARMAGVFYPSSAAVYDGLAREAMAGVGGASQAASAAFAAEVVDACLAARAGDGAANTLTYIPKDSPGKWRRTPPRFRPPELSHWGNVRPFVLPAASHFRPPPPPAIDSEAYAQAVEEVRLRGSAGPADARTDAQTLSARFWSDFSYTFTPAGHWNEILCGIFAARGEGDLRRIAECYALLNLALADAAIATWDCKYHYEMWRPVDAIRRADEDGNPLTRPDPEWKSLLEAPPHPEYVSGHSAFSGAAAAMLARLFGTDAVAFTARSTAVPGVELSYSSFSECANECGGSRVFGGIHFSFSNREGLTLGRSVAAYVHEHAFRPL